MGVPLEFSWISKAHDPIEHQLISWEAVSGLENRGRVEFQEISEESAVDVSMSVDYKLPRILSMVFRSVLAVGNLYLVLMPGSLCRESPSKEEEGRKKSGVINSAVQRIIQVGSRPRIRPCATYRNNIFALHARHELPRTQHPLPLLPPSFPLRHAHRLFVSACWRRRTSAASAPRPRRPPAAATGCRKQPAGDGPDRFDSQAARLHSDAGRWAVRNPIHYPAPPSHPASCVTGLQGPRARLPAVGLHGRGCACCLRSGCKGAGVTRFSVDSSLPICSQS
jgi:hypothetical protein